LVVGTGSGLGTVLKRKKRMVWLDIRVGREVTPQRRPNCSELLSCHARFLGRSDL